MNNVARIKRIVMLRTAPYEGGGICRRLVRNRRVVAYGTAGQNPCGPYGIRTRVSTLRGWCPRPLDEGTWLGRLDSNQD